MNAIVRFGLVAAMFAAIGAASASETLTGTIVSSPSNGGTADKPEFVADGNTSTCFNSAQSKGEKLYIGYDFGAVKEVDSVTYCPRNGRIYRLTNAVIQVACFADFSDAKVGCVLPPTEAEIPFELTTVTFDTPLVGRYARICTLPADKWFSIAELSFTGTDLALDPTLAGTVFASAQTAGAANNPANANDGNLATCYNSAQIKGEPICIGYDFGVVKDVSSVTFCPRSDRIQRLTNAVVEVSANADFSDAQVGCVLPATTAGIPYQLNTIVFERPLAGRYARIRTMPADSYFSIAELSFSGFPHADIETSRVANLAATSENRLTGGYPTVSWTDTTGGALGTAVWRATAADGPWTKVATLGKGVTSWTDEGLAMGVRYYYDVTYVDGEASGPSAPVVAAYRRIHRLERTVEDNTKLKTGVRAVVSDTGNEKNASWCSSNAFDGDTNSNLSCSKPDTRIAVVFDQGNVGVEVVRAHTCMIRVTRLQKARVYATNGNYLGDNPQVSVGGFPYYEGWCSVECDDPKCWRAYYLMRPDHSDFYSCLSELELYGWTAEEEQDVLIAPTRLFKTVSASGVALSWDVCNRAATYRVEKLVGETWTALATVSTPSYLDSAATLNERVSYRIVSLPAEGTETAISQTFTIVPYLPGNGTGLTAVYTHPFSNNVWTANEESFAVTNVEPNIDYDWAHAPFVPTFPSVSYQRGRWYGKLIVPITGEYTFKTLVARNGMGGVAIDGVWVANQGQPAADVVEESTMTLTAGEHDIYAEYVKWANISKLSLSWSGPVAEEVIPSTQFVPCAPHDFGDWTFERTVNVSQSALPNLAKAFPWGEGGVRFNRGRGRFSGGTYRGHVLARDVKGDFEFTCKLKCQSPAAPSGQRFALFVADSRDPKCPMALGLLGWSATGGGSGAFCTGVRKVRETDDLTSTTYSPFVNVGKAAFSAGEGRMRVSRLSGKVSFAYYDESKQGWVAIGTIDDAADYIGRHAVLGLLVVDDINSPADVIWDVSEMSFNKMGGLTVLIK